MTSSEERLAPVTYLFGEQPEQGEQDVPEPAPSVDDLGFTDLNNAAMRALGRRGMSTDELRRLLRDKGYETDDVEAELERLEQVGLLDDAAYAESLAERLRDRKGLGRSALSAELRRRGLDSAAIEAATDTSREDELERAKELARSRAGRMGSLDRETAERRLSAFLMRKGYGGSVVSAAVSEALRPPSSGPVFR
jgi:regulatory protein